MISLPELVQRYFGNALGQLVEAKNNDDYKYNGKFVDAAFHPEKLEARLQRIEHLGLTQEILKEVRMIVDPQILDERLRSAWAEIRMVDYLHTNDFLSINKVTEVADLTAQKDERSYAFQVRRVFGSVSKQVEKRNLGEQRSSSPYGSLENIYSRLNIPVSYVFWDALIEKNRKFKKWQDSQYSRVIVIVTEDEALQDVLTRHIACRQIRCSIHSLEGRHFEELMWFPDTGNGALFIIGNTPSETRCFADWGDQEFNFRQQPQKAKRREIDLNSPTNSWKGEVE